LRFLLVSGLPLREPVRSLVWIRGRVHNLPRHALREATTTSGFRSPRRCMHDVGGLGRAIRALMGCPFVNGLRARRL